GFSGHRSRLSRCPGKWNLSNRSRAVLRAKRCGDCCAGQYESDAPVKTSRILPAHLEAFKFAADNRLANDGPPGTDFPALLVNQRIRGLGLSSEHLQEYIEQDRHHPRSFSKVPMYAHSSLEESSACCPGLLGPRSAAQGRE